MRRYLMATLGALTAFALVLILGGIIAAIATAGGPDVEDGSYLVIDFKAELPEYDPPGSVLGQISGEDVETLQRVLDNLDKARVDERITGVILRMDSEATLRFAAVQEIHDATARLRDAGKQVHGWFDASFTQPQYLLLSACDRIYALPSVWLHLAGTDIESTHIKRALDKLNITTNMHKIEAYKSAAEMFLREDMSESARENRQWMADEMWEMFVATVKERRGLDEAKITALMERALFTGKEAVEAGLVDELLYWDQLKTKLRPTDLEEDEQLELISSAEYAEVERGDLDLEGDQTIAVIHGQGMIFGRENDTNPMLGMLMGHETIREEFRRAREDEDVAAVVFRVDSRGGSGLASDMISRELELTNEKKPVIVSMANVAASGGYAVAYRAPTIVANPMTVTGSIGSISGKLNLTGLYNMLGITHDHVTKGPNALLFSDKFDFTEAQRARFEEHHWASFHVWLEDIVKYREMELGELEKLAHGRVFTGRQAAANGLIDELGGQRQAIELARKAAGIPAEEEVTIEHFPEAKSPIESILGGDDDKDLAMAARWLLHRQLRHDLATTVTALQSGVAVE